VTLRQQGESQFHPEDLVVRDWPTYQVFKPTGEQYASGIWRHKSAMTIAKSLIRRHLEGS